MKNEKLNIKVKLMEPDTSAVVLSKFEVDVLREVAAQYYIALDELGMSQIIDGVRLFGDVDKFLERFKKDKAIEITKDMLAYRTFAHSEDELEPLTLRSWKIAMAENKAYEARESLVRLLKAIVGNQGSLLNPP